MASRIVNKERLFVSRPSVLKKKGNFFPPSGKFIHQSQLQALAVPDAMTRKISFSGAESPLPDFTWIILAARSLVLVSNNCAKLFPSLSHTLNIWQNEHESKTSLSATDVKKLTHQMSLVITVTEISLFLKSDLVMVETVWRHSDSSSTRKIGGTKLAVHKRFKIWLQCLMWLQSLNWEQPLLCCCCMMRRNCAI